MQWVRSSLRWIFVTLGVVLLTSITVDATLSPNGFSQSALGILATQAVPEAQCPDGTVLLTFQDKELCVDAFEVSPGSECPVARVQSMLDTRANIDIPSCIPESRKGGNPWTEVAFHQAYELCARAGKRLPSSEEWYAFAAGTPDSISSPVCNTGSGAQSLTGSRDACKNGNGIYDAIGNVWEWVDAEVKSGTYDGRTLPPSGYVSGVDRAGVAQHTTDQPSDQYYRDYFWSDSEGEYGLLRGGFFGSGEDGGLYSVQAKTPLTFASGAIGFRCVDDL